MTFFFKGNSFPTEATHQKRSRSERALADGSPPSVGRAADGGVSVLWRFPSSATAGAISALSRGPGAGAGSSLTYNYLFGEARLSLNSMIGVTSAGEGRLSVVASAR